MNACYTFARWFGWTPNDVKQLTPAEAAFFYDLIAEEADRLNKK